MTLFAPVANAATPNLQITNLKNKNAQTEQSKQQLGRQAANLSDVIASLQAEIAGLDAQIGKTEANVANLNQEIASAEAELARQRGLLGLNVRQMYTEQDISTLEMLASSQNFSHFLDQEQYRSSLQEKIDATTKRIEKLTVKLQREKQSVEHLLADQKAMQEHASARRAENVRLLSLNQQQQQAYQNNINANSAEIARLQDNQSKINRKGFVSQPTPVKVAASNSGKSYPWANAPFPNTISDPWGMYKRQCVSYTAWKVADSGRHMPYWGGRGNAKLWDDNARRAGIPVDGSPRVGDVAISNAGTYGHAMYVEAVHGDGTITISQYNAGWDGKYSEGRRKAAGLAFIHF